VNKKWYNLTRHLASVKVEADGDITLVFKGAGGKKAEVLVPKFPSGAARDFG